MDDQTANIKLEVAREFLKSQTELYKELSESWKALDAKAQGTAATAGIFLAAAFAFVRDLRTHLVYAEKLLLLIALLGLACSILTAVWSVRVVSVDYPRNDKLVEDILSPRAADQLGERLPAFYRDQQLLWQEHTAQFAERVCSKSYILGLSQLALAASAIAVLSLCVVVLFSPSLISP